MSRVTETELLTADTNFVSAVSLREKLDWFNRLRWWAVGCIVLSIFTATMVLGHPLAVKPLLMISAVLALLNLGYVIRNLRISPVDITMEIRQVKLEMVADLLILTVMLHFSGGIENPLYFMYLIHVILASLLFKGRDIYRIAFLAMVLFTGETLGEYLGILPHHHLASAGEASHELPYILLNLFTFWLVLSFSAYIGASIMKHNRAIKNDLVCRQDDLIQADRAKMDFFRFITHEIKSPINTAYSAVEVALDLDENGMSDKAADMLQRALGQLEQATTIVLDLADLTRSGLLKAENMRIVDLNQLVGRCVEQQMPVAARKEIKIEVSLPDTPVVVKTNGAMFEKIVDNLVSNAIRYNRQAGRLSVRLTDDGLVTRLEVEDSGIGIAVEDRERIFEEFFRSASAMETSNLGTGLGLPIVKRFVDTLEGNIAIASTVDQGSIFTVEFPRLQV